MLSAMHLLSTTATLVASASPADSEPGPATVDVVWISAGPLDGAALASDLRVRLPHVQTFQHQVQPPPPRDDTLIVYVGVTGASVGTALGLELVTSDGRAFDRTVRIDAEWTPAERRRVVARNVANLVEGIEAGVEAPDREDVAPPRAVDCPEPAPVKCPQPRPEPIPGGSPPSEAQPDATRTPPGWELGPTLAFGGVIGLGAPADTDRFAGGGIGLGLHARLPSGLVLLAELRGFGRASTVADTALVRLRTSVGAGYAWRPASQHAEVAATAGFGVEPWFVRRNGERSDVEQRVPAVGAWVRIAPGVLWDLGPARVRLGGWFEVAASAVPSNGGRVAKVVVETEGATAPAFRVGGAELAGGLETVIWLAVPPRRR